MAVRFTRKLVEGVEKPEAGDVRLQDELVPALWLKVTSTGQRSWFAYYRVAGRRRRPKLGDWPTMDIESARKAARTVVGEAATGRDLSAERQSVRRSPTVEALMKRYLEQHAEPHKAKASAYNDKLMIAAHIVPAMGTAKVVEVIGDDVARLLAAVGRHHPVTANRVRSLLSKAFNLAEAWGLRPRNTNPVAGIARFREPKRRMALTPSGMGRLAVALDALRDQGGYEAQVADFIALLALTGGRRDEIRTAHRGLLLPERRSLRVPENKERNPDKVIPMGATAWAIVAARSLASRNDWLFPSQRRADRPMGPPRRLWSEVKVAAELDPGLHLHDLRHTFASAALGLGYSLAQIGGLLGQSNEATTETYAYLLDDPRRAAATEIDAMLGGWMKKGASRE